MAKVATNLKFGDKVKFRSGARGRAADAVILHAGPRKITVYRDRYDMVERIKPEDIVEMA